LSTRVARFAGPRDTKIEEIAVGYLVDAAESNNDATNFWIFSVTGLKRLCDRAGWDMIELMTLGDTRRSNPSAQDRDERAFCLLRSRNV
jgi:tRNA (mo5U34)-methyltransferase